MSALVLFSLPAAAVEPVEPRIGPLALGPVERAELGGRLDALPAGIGAVLAEREGQPFLLLTEDRSRSATDAKEALERLAELLPAAGYDGILDSLVVVDERDEAPVDSAWLDAQVVALEQALYRPFVALAGAPTPATVEEITATAVVAGEALLASRRAWILTQEIEGAPIDGAGLAIVAEEGWLSAVEGALFVDLAPSNAPWLAPGDAENIAASAADGKPVALAPVVLPVGAELRHAFRIQVEGSDGLQDVWVDAESGAVHQLLPVSLPASAQGTIATRPDASGVRSTQAFEVDPAVNGVFPLTHSTSAVMVNFGADGVFGAIGVGDLGTGIANFATAPFNVTTNVTTPGPANYNTLFQHVNVRGWTERSNDLFRALGSKPISVQLLMVNNANACGVFGPDNACASRGFVDFGIGSFALGDPNGLRNTALDGTVVVHEVAHAFHADQLALPDGTLLPRMNAALNEGLADHWARIVTNVSTMGGFTAMGRPASEVGLMPRVGDAGDVFPEHLHLGGGNNRAHASGEVVSWATRQSREELARRSFLGPILFDMYLVKVMPPVGMGQSLDQDDTSVHNALRRLLIGLVGRAGNTLDAQDIIVGFARAGITVSPQESIATIDQDVIPTTRTTPPIVTVWTGRDYHFVPGIPQALDVSLLNLVYTVEMANDEGFTVNLASSGTRVMPQFAVGLPSSAWAPTAAEWQALRNGGNRVYYRVTSHDGGGGRLRTSDRFNQQSIALPVTYAVLNAPGGGGCSTSGRDAGLVALGAAMLAARRRRALARRDPTGDSGRWEWQ